MYKINEISVFVFGANTIEHIAASVYLPIALHSFSGDFFAKNISVYFAIFFFANHKVVFSLLYFIIVNHREFSVKHFGYFSLAKLGSQ